MAALHEALKSLGPVKFAETPVDDLPSYLSPLFASGELIVDSVPVASSTDSSTPPTPATPGRSEGFAKIHVSSSNVQGPPPAPEVEALRKEWKPVKLSAKENPLNINVYKCSGKDGNGAWFARRSVHEGLSFDKWKRAFQNELPQSMKSEVMGEGNVRGIGAEKRLEEYDVEGLGKLEGPSLI